MLLEDKALKDQVFTTTDYLRENKSKGILLTPLSMLENWGKEKPLNSNFGIHREVLKTL